MTSAERKDAGGRPTLVTVQLPLPWVEFDLPEIFQAGTTALTTGEIGWAWEPANPEMPIRRCPVAAGTTAEGWGLDHVVLLVADLGDAVARLRGIGCEPRLRMEVGGRPTAFFRVGPVLEVIEAPVRATALFGVALVTDEPLEVVALRWRTRGLDVTDPRPAIQPARRIFTVRATEVGLAVMSPDR